MQKRFKTVSMMLFLMGAISGTAVAAPTLAADDVRITQQTNTCIGTVKDAAGEAIIGASVVVKGLLMVPLPISTVISRFRM